MDYVKISNTVLPLPVAQSVDKLAIECFDSIGVVLGVVDGFKPATAIRTDTKKATKE